VREILDETLRMLESCEEFALVKVSADSGSTPRAAGAEMLVRRDGSIVGTIGGGLLELTMMKAAGEAIERRRWLLTGMGLTGTDVRRADEMLCGGAVDVLITYVPAGDPALLEVCRAAAAAVRDRRRGWLFTILPAGDSAAPESADGGLERCLLLDDGTVAGALQDAAVLRATLGSLALHGSAVLPDGRSVLVEPFEPAATVVICGGGHVGQALAPVAVALGFGVVVIDDRAEFADSRRFTGATAMHLPFAGALERAGVDAHCYVVIVTRGHVHDVDVLRQALRSPARYVGLMASRGKRARVWAALREEGFTETELARVHSPIGLEIGAETPAELAISIAAELIRVRAGAEG